jgi:C-terminal processing protease CtpA/Prc
MSQPVKAGGISNMYPKRSVDTLRLILAAALILALPAFALAQTPDDATQPGWLGVSVQDVTDDLSEALPRGVHEGALINGVVDDSPADVAGLREGDVVVKLNQDRIRNTGDLTRVVRDAGAGEKVLVEYYREGRRLRANVLLTEREEQERTRDRQRQREGRTNLWTHRDRDHDDDDDPQVYFFDGRENDLLNFKSDGPRLGVHLQDLDGQLAEYFGVAAGVGTLVKEVVEDSPAEAAGIHAGDVITAMDGRPVGDAEDVRKVLRKHDEGGPVEIALIRKGQPKTVTAELEEVNRQSYRSSARWPQAHTFRIPDFEWDQEGFDEQMDELREQLEELKQDLSEMRKDLR